MNERTLRILEFDKVKAEIQRYTMCSLGRMQLDTLSPLATVEAAEAELAAVDEALQFVYRLGTLPFGGITDVSTSLRKVGIGGVLGPEELLAIAEFMRGGRAVKHAIEGSQEIMALQHLPMVAGALFDARQTEMLIRQAIGDDATVLDTASDGLRRIRTEKRAREARVRQVLENMLRTHQRYLQESLIAMRGNSFCLPVRVDYKNLVPGVIHDYSASGATVYIEPHQAVEATQLVRELVVEEEREIERILQRLSGEVATIDEPLLANREGLATLDAWFAKASYAKQNRCERPSIRADGVWRLRQAHHPLIDRELAVPVDLSLGAEYAMLIITGPNTGGKTVTLKTMGLLTALAMSGCFIHTTQPSEVGWCDDIFADIGDEQSIEQSLSTFSSHMRTIVATLNQVTSESLVLLDELGAGTDPGEGSALAISILDALNAWGCRVVATTHYPEMKGYAFSEPRAINASMEFDVETLRPTYRLLVGVPGRSNALAIASRLGLSDRIIERARRLLSQGDVRTEDLIGRIEEARRLADTARQEAQADRAVAQALRTQWEEADRVAQHDADRRIEEAATAARAILEKAQSEANRVIAELRKRQQGGTVKDHELVNLRKSLEDALPGETHTQRAVRTRKQTVEVGSVVRLMKLGQKGEVVELSADGRDAYVALGVLRTKVNVRDLEVLQQAATQQKVVTTRRGLPNSVSLQLDVRGETVEDAWPRVDKYLDEAVMNSLKRVTIIHGKGTGALRDGIRRLLTRHAHVESWQAGGAGEGGDGATVVTLHT